HGILVQLPLPPGIDAARVLQSISPAKDVDGFHFENVGKLSTGESLDSAFVPCTPAGVMVLLRAVHGKDLSGLHAVVIGRSNIVGKPMASLLLAANATVTVAHSRTAGLGAIARQADILIAAVGRPELVRQEWIKPGATVIDVTLSPLGLFTDVNGLITAAEAYAIHQEWLQKTPHLYGERCRLRIMAGAFVSAADYVNAQRERARLVQEVTAVMAGCDLLMMPTRQMTAPELGDYDSSAGPSLTRPFNMTGFPALSLCNGFDRNGLPTSLQIAGRPFEDSFVLKAGNAYEKATSFRSLRPTLAAPSLAAD
ncbi:MAG: hypothetical protein J0H57_01070, partial [Rhodospirillales bacterium]|nr:hypothetical protein [Rhodospirillales bacterium]